MLPEIFTRSNEDYPIRTDFKEVATAPPTEPTARKPFPYEH